LVGLSQLVNFFLGSLLNIQRVLELTTPCGGMTEITIAEENCLPCWEVSLYRELLQVLVDMAFLFPLVPNLAP
jgi:hypothetical protein